MARVALIWPCLFHRRVWLGLTKHWPCWRGWPAEFGLFDLVMLGLLPWSLVFQGPAACRFWYFKSSGCRGTRFGALPKARQVSQVYLAVGCPRDFGLFDSINISVAGERMVWPKHFHLVVLGSVTPYWPTIIYLSLRKYTITNE